jgi:hypothetical protein
LFTNVLKKFFTIVNKFENKGATNSLTTGTAKMFTELKSVIERSSATLFGDFIGAAALVLMLIVGLHLPGLT